MHAFYIILIIIAVLVLISLLRVGVLVHAESGAELRLAATAGFLKIRILPKKQKPEKKQEKPEKPKKSKKEKPEKEKKKYRYDIKKLISGGLDLLSSLKHKLLLRRLELVYIAPGLNDPASAAQMHGRLAGIAGFIYGAAQSAFRIRHEHIVTNTDFTRDEAYYLAEVSISIALWEILYIGIAALRLFLHSRHEVKAEPKPAAADTKAAEEPAAG
ncbi:MAG: DUF2953 domain-containing protein [Oscillospiraceae bacterium]|jgi:hypothetical protein|nr:DUF2953 domain-containing protein [Oscillospiraceae bacterium]